MNTIQILMPEAEDINELVAINTDFFASVEQTNRILCIPRDRYRYYAEHITLRAFKEGQILVTKEEDKITGYLIWEDYCKPLYAGMAPNPDVYKLIAPEIAFVEQLESKLNEEYDFEENECAKLLQVGVLPEFQHEGIAKLLTSAAIDKIKTEGYKYIIADCTAENSWQILVKFGFETISEIAYSDFEFEGEKFFGQLDGKRRLVIKQLYGLSF